MTRVPATYDGEVFRPDEPLPLPPNTRVVLTVETPEPNGASEPYAFLKAARAANLQGPPDWSERVDEYLYGTERDG